MGRASQTPPTALAFALTLSLVALDAGGCGENDDLSTGPTRGSNGGSGSNRIKLAAVVTDRSGTCPSIRFRLGGIQVQTNTATDFELACDRVVNGAEVQADAPAMNDGVLPSRDVEAEDDAAEEPDFETEGAVESLSSPGDCTTTTGRSVTAQGLRFTVGTFTRFRDISGGCEGLAVGVQVRARGALTNPPLIPVLPPRATEIERR